MGLRQAWWSFITRWVTLGQNETHQTGRTNRQLSATQYKFLDAVRALGGSAGQRILHPRVHGPPADGLFDSETSEEDPKLQAGRLQVATHRLSYDSLIQPYNPCHRTCSKFMPNTNVHNSGGVCMQRGQPDRLVDQACWNYPPPPLRKHGRGPTPCLDKAVHTRDTCDSHAGNNIVSHG